MKKTISKTEAEKQIEDFFSHIKGKTSKEIKKIQRLAMSYKIKLGERRKTFCKKCLHPYIEPGIRIKNDMITITCENCLSKSRWKFKEDNILTRNDPGEEECEC
jgi:RNase P subunit RPR2